MRFCIVVGVCLVTAIGSTAFAQTTPSFEASVGYSWLHQRPGFDRRGWVASAAKNVNSWFGVKGEVGGDYSDPIHQDVHSFLGGAQFTVRRNSSVTPWAHFLIGVVRTGEGGVQRGPIFLPALARTLLFSPDSASTFRYGQTSASGSVPIIGVVLWGLSIEIPFGCKPESCSGWMKSRSFQNEIKRESTSGGLLSGLELTATTLWLSM
jgi:hypothetical protein